MRLYAFFLILNFQLGQIFASPPYSLELSLQTSRYLRGYECGNHFFPDVDVKQALSLARAYLDNEYQYPQRYIGPLYSDSRFEEYFLYPVRNGQQFLPQFKHTYTVFYIVLTRNGDKEVDVVAKITNGDYTKCIREHGTHTEPSQSVSEKPNGYLCAHEFFSDEIIHEALAIAQTKAEGDPNYPSSYSGSLYPGQSGLLIWPILGGKALYNSGAGHATPYFLILNNQRQVIDAVVRGYNNNFLRCIRSRKPPKAPASDPFSKLFVPPPKPGYLCHKVFFGDTLLEGNAEIAKSEAGNGNRFSFPVEYSGPPYNEKCLIWPILQDGKLFRKGLPGPYRLILTPDYRVLSVAMFGKGRLKACDRKTIIAKTNHDTSDYHCNEQQFSHQQLVAAGEEACVKMKNRRKAFYPARYEGPGFMLAGPYFTYPVFENKARKFRSHTGLHRVVISTNCEVVGALTTLQMHVYGGPDHRLQKRLVKCHRLDDGPLPQGFFDANAQTVFEH